MADQMANELFQRLARLGAAIRLRELETEIDEIRTALQGLAGAAGTVSRPASKWHGRWAAAGRQEPAHEERGAPGKEKKKPAGKKRQLTPEQREAIRDRMKRYWARRREKRELRQELEESACERADGRPEATALDETRTEALTTEQELSV
ncbi:MAG: hypothetical protein ACE148_09395 [Vicinamibacterales bacterium]